MDEYLASTEIVDWQTPSVRAVAAEFAGEDADSERLIANTFCWVRDRVTHSFDVSGDPPVTCSASDVLRHRTGICYAKSHLLAALLRANGIPAAFGYQRLSVSGEGAPYCLHAFNYVRLACGAWHPLDARGNKPGIATRFAPPTISLAFPADLPGEQTYESVRAEPLPVVVEALQRASDVNALRRGLPDGPADAASQL